MCDWLTNKIFHKKKTCKLHLQPVMNFCRHGCFTCNLILCTASGPITALIPLPPLVLTVPLFVNKTMICFLSYNDLFVGVTLHRIKKKQKKTLHTPMPWSVYAQCSYRACTQFFVKITLNTKVHFCKRVSVTPGLPVMSVDHAGCTVNKSLS